MVAALLVAGMAACGTGIENTERVTDKDVIKAMQEMDSRRPVSTLETYRDSVAAWRVGKAFHVSDDQVKLLFSHSNDYDLDTVHLAGHTLVYQGYDTGSVYDNRQTVNLRLQDPASNNTYVYRTSKTINELGQNFRIPLLIDMDLVAHVARQVAGKDYYVCTPIWYDRASGQMTDGRQFIQVHIDSVQPGNNVMPLRVLFTTADTGERAMVWMSDNASTMHGRDFDALFTATDPHLGYPTITDANWELITRQQVAVGMTKQECRLALGAPARTSQNPDQRGMREYWYYDGGAYLYFVDGLLTQFRR